MAHSTSKRKLIVLAVLAVVTMAVSLAIPATSAALPDYTTKTGQTCTVCHTTASGGPLTAKGSAFAAVANHATDPAAAFAQISAPPAAPATPTKPAATAPAATTTAASGSTTTTSAPAAAASTASAGAPTATAGVSATSLPAAGGIAVPFLPLMVMSLVAVGLGILFRRRQV